MLLSAMSSQSEESGLFNRLSVGDYSENATIAIFVILLCLIYLLKWVIGRSMQKSEHRHLCCVPQLGNLGQEDSARTYARELMWKQLQEYTPKKRLRYRKRCAGQVPMVRYAPCPKRNLNRDGMPLNYSWRRKGVPHHKDYLHCATRNVAGISYNYFTVMSDCRSSGNRITHSVQGLGGFIQRSRSPVKRDEGNERSREKTSREESLEQKSAGDSQRSKNYIATSPSQASSYLSYLRQRIFGPHPQPLSTERSQSPQRNSSKPLGLRPSIQRSTSPSVRRCSSSPRPNSITSPIPRCPPCKRSSGSPLQNPTDQLSLLDSYIQLSKAVRSSCPSSASADKRSASPTHTKASRPLGPSGLLRRNIPQIYVDAFKHSASANNPYPQRCLPSSQPTDTKPKYAGPPFHGNRPFPHGLHMSVPPS